MTAAVEYVSGEWDTSACLKALFKARLSSVEDEKSGGEKSGEAESGKAVAAADEIWKTRGKELVRQWGVAEDGMAYVQRYMLEHIFEPMARRQQGESACECTEKPVFSSLSFGTMLNARDPDFRGETCSRKERRKAFAEAMEWVEKVLRDTANEIDKCVRPSYELTRRAAEKRTTVGGGVVVIELEHYCNWSSHVYDIERELDIVGDIKWVVFQDDRNHQFRAQSVSAEGNRFNNRVHLHEDLRGLRNEELAAKLNCDTHPMLFVHQTGFTGGAPTRDLMMRIIAYGSAQ